MRPLATLLLALALLLPGCAPPEPAIMQHALETAASKTGGRAAAAKELTTEFTAHRISVAGAIDFAYDVLEATAAGQAPSGLASPVPSADATALAGAVLDMCVAVEPQLPKADEFALMWTKMGRLAFRAAEEAHAANRVPEAMNLVFAGPKKWQNDAYWYQSPDHDALASVLLAKSGDRATAISRLQSRADLRGPAQEVFDMLQQGR